MILLKLQKASAALAIYSDKKKVEIVQLLNRGDSEG